MAGADAPGGMVEGLRKKKDSAPRTKRPLDSSQGGYVSRPRGSTYSPAQHRSSETNGQRRICPVSAIRGVAGEERWRN